MISGADIMVKCLENEGVSIVFGYPGAAICPFYDSLFNPLYAISLSGRSKIPYMRQAAMQGRQESRVCVLQLPARALRT